MKIKLLLVLPLFFVLSCVKDSASGTDNDGGTDHGESQEFVHPGITVSLSDIERMRKLVANQVEPAWSAYKKLSEHPYAQSDYVMNGPYEVISKNHDKYSHANNEQPDFAAAYCNALMWIITQDNRHAEKALDIIWKYSTVLKEVDISKGIILLNGFSSFHIAKTMEILCYTYDVPQDKLDSIKKMLREKFIPHMTGDLSKAPYHIGNQDAVGCRGIMACGIFLDDRELYDWAKDFYLNSDHNGCVKNYIHPETGQCQESGRDQTHAQLGLGVMAELCEIAWKQGDDLYSAYDNLILKGFEYTAKYNVGLSVPFEVMYDVTKRPDWAWKSLSSQDRGIFLPYYEYVYNHFRYRRGMNQQTEMTAYLLTEADGGRPETYLQKSDLQHTFASLVCVEAD